MPESPFTANTVTIRDAQPGDLQAIQSIYAYEVLNGVATFEEIPPGIEELGHRRDNVLALGLPYLVAERDGQVVGFAYATAYRPRSAYRFTVENSVYVAPRQRGTGVGRALLTALIGRCEQGPSRQMVSVIGDRDNSGSIALHKALGFHTVGTLTGAGFKQGRWVDTVLMQRALNAGSDSLPGE